MKRSPIRDMPNKFRTGAGWAQRAFGRVILISMLAVLLAGWLQVRPVPSQTETTRVPAWTQSPMNSEPPWWQELNMVGGGNEPLKMLRLFDVIGWGYGADTEWAKQFLWRQVGRIHAQGGRYIGELQLWDIYSNVYMERPELLDAVVIDIDGQPVETFDSTPEDPVYWGNTNHPIYQAFLLEQCRAMVEAGVDGIAIDEMHGTATSLAFGGSFGEPDMSLFRAYLAETYTPQELLDQFGIEDVETFDYGEYIHEHGLVDEWKADPWSVPLFEDFDRFQTLAIHDFLTELTSEIRSYAQTAYGRELVFTGNVYALSAEGLIFGHLLDYYTVEYPYWEYGYPPQSQAIPDYKLARALRDQPAVFLPANIPDLTARDSTSTLMTILIAEAYANKGAMMSIHGWFSYVADWDVLVPVYRFVLDNAFLYEELDSLAQIAVLYSFPSDLDWWWFYRASFRGLTYALLDGHVQYDILVLGDDLRLADTFAATSLAPYELAFLPGAACLSDEQVGILLSFVNGGGTVVAWGNTGISDEQCQETERPELTALTVPGTHTYGEGWFITLADDPGAAYLDTHDPAARQQLVSLVNDYADPVTVTSAERTLNLLAYERMDGSQVVAHLINYDYDIETDQITATGPFTMTLEPPAGFIEQENVQVYRMSPPDAAPSLLDFALADGLLVINHPGVDIFDVVVAMPEEDAAVLASETLDELADEIAQAQAEGYDTSSLDELLSQIDNALAAGNHLLARQLGLEALDLLHLLTRPHILFDEAHGERNTLSWDRAVEIDPEHPEWVYFGTLAVLDDEFVFERNPDAPLTSQLLQDYNALMLSAPEETLDANELEAVNQFVARGGGLVVLGDCGLHNPVDGPINGLTSAYDITFDPYCIFAPWQEGDLELQGDFVVDAFADHQATRGVPFIVTNYGGSLTVGDSSVRLAVTDNDIWRDANDNGEYDPGEPTGPFTIAAAYEAGQARVVVVADNPFLDDGFDGRMNDVFMRSLLKWVTGWHPPYGYHVYLPVVFRGWSR